MLFYEHVSTHCTNRFLRRGSGPQGNAAITGPVMAQYLMALLGGQRDHMGGLSGLSDGRMGDYVFNQEGKRLCLV